MYVFPIHCFLISHQSITSMKTCSICNGPNFILEFIWEYPLEIGHVKLWSKLSMVIVMNMFSWSFVGTWFTWFDKIRRISKALSWLILMPLLASLSTDLHFPVFAWIINPTNIGKGGSFFLKCRKCFISSLSSISARSISSSSVRVTALPCLSTQRLGTLTNIFSPQAS